MSRAEARRWISTAAAVCFTAAAVPPSTGAQACGERSAPVPLPVQYWMILPQAFRPFDGGLLVTGQNPLRARFSATHELEFADSSASGFVVGDGDRVRSVPQPVPGRRVWDARHLELGEDSVLIVFESIVPVMRPLDQPQTELWSALLTRDGWSEVRPVATLEGQFRLDPLFSSEFRRVGDEHWLAGMYRPDSAGETPRLMLLKVRGDTIRLDPLDLGIDNGSYVDLHVNDGVPTLAFTATFNDLLPPDGRVRYASIWTTRYVDGRWSEPAESVLGGFASVVEPRLLNGDDGLVLAWIDRRASRLHWRGIEPGQPDAIHSLPMIGVLRRGLPPYDHLVAVRQADSTVVAVELTPGGHRELLRLRASFEAGFIGSDENGPIMFIFDTSGRPAWQSALRAYRIPCARPRR